MPRRLVHLATIVALFATLFTGAIVPTSAAPADATLNVTFLTCPPGGDWSGPPPGCTDVVAAPETATVTATPDWVQPVDGLPQNADGSYTVDVPAGDIGLVNFFSPDFNAFTFEGVDAISRWYGALHLDPGEVRNVTVFYWNGPIDLITPAENTLVVDVFACDEGVDPTVNASGCAPWTGDVPDLYIGTSPLRQIKFDEYLTREGGTFTYTGLPAYTQAQVVVQQPLAGYGKALVTGQAEEIGDNSATAFLLRGETRVIEVYFFAPDGSSRTPAPTETPAAGTGTLRLTLLSCPVGVVPHDDPGKCTEPMADDGSAIVSFPETGERVALTRFQRDDAGAYLITGVRSSVTISGISLRDRDRIASDADQISGQEITYTVTPGQTRDGRLYYFDKP